MQTHVVCTGACHPWRGPPKAPRATHGLHRRVGGRSRGEGAPPSPHLSGGAVGCRGHRDMLPKQGRKGTVVGAADLKTDHAEGHVSLNEELLGTLDPAPEDVLV